MENMFVTGENINSENKTKLDQTTEKYERYKNSLKSHKKGEKPQTARNRFQHDLNWVLILLVLG